MGTFDWWAVQTNTKAEWKSVSMDSGALFVKDTDIVGTGTLQMLILFADSWDFQV